MLYIYISFKKKKLGLKYKTL